MVKLWPRSNKSKRVPGRIRVDHAAYNNNNHEVASHGESLLSSEATAQLEEMRGAMTKMERQMSAQNKQVQSMMQQQSQQMNVIMATLDTSHNDGGVHEEDFPVDVGSYEIEYDKTMWSVTGVSSRVPKPDYDYFPGLKWDEAAPENGMARTNEDKVVSCIIPCYNEEGKELERTIRGLSRQIMPEGWRVEAVIVMDGMYAMSESMAAYLCTLFGVDFGSEDPTVNPFGVFPDANTIIVHPFDQAAAQTRRPVMEGTVAGGFSLVVKRENRRKANSQQWWLGPHASTIRCKYALATDCGTYFERTTAARLIERLDDDRALHAVTGTQRTMPASIQGDGDYELCYRPFHFLLRQLQRFEFEVDNVSFMSVYNSLGAMHVIPGPCGLYRYNKLGSLTEGLMCQYFQLFSRSNKGLILGNVELVEDRIPGTLLAFPPKKSSKDLDVMPLEGFGRTGLVDEVFYMEAEKPLSQLVKQRRRWLNGTFATYLWILQEGIITNSNQDPIAKALSWFLVVLGVIQGMVVRLFGPALLIVWMFRFGLFAPDLLHDPEKIFDPTISLAEVEVQPGRLRDGIAFGLAYWLLYVLFILGHTPRAKPINDEIGIVRYTEPTRWKNDSGSAYRPILFHLVLWVNLIVTLLYVVNAIGMMVILGWETPLAVQMLIAFCFLPFAAGLLDGIAKCNFSGLWAMILSAPFALPLMITHTIWLPAYATTRLSDLSWGNRSRKSLDETENALKREAAGRKVSQILVGFNSAVALLMIILMQFYGNAFPVYVVSYTIVLSLTYAVSFIEIFCRALGCLGGGSSRVVEPEPDEEAYQKLEDKAPSSPSSGGVSSFWCCLRSSGSDDTANTAQSIESVELGNLGITGKENPETNENTAEKKNPPEDEMNEHTAVEALI
ncbi:Chitin synthase [Seminavis robusta]|uniref:chitin synthase n=1 Tax=Seminavis robusta TaxID=568900 RepID=A0A9N8H3D6_9STRA|nr:Chitin synthase [Seminavis robusta]|eukprot:Sro24_g016540.1 Chitin synthase (895) ;mRNA; r:133785-136788